MSIALVSDIHGNVTGMRAVLDFLEQQNVNTIVAAGDIIGGSSGCEDLIDLLTEHDVELVRGNSEEMLLDFDDNLKCIEEKHRAYAADLDVWYQTHFSDSYRHILRETPLSRLYSLSHGTRVLVCHAVPDDPWARICRPDVPAKQLEQTYGDYDADVIAYGHYHRSHVIRIGAKLLVNVASVGFRPDGIAMCTIIDDELGYVSVQQHAIAFDADEEAELNRKHDVPEYYTTS